MFYFTFTFYNSLKFGQVNTFAKCFKRPSIVWWAVNIWVCLSGSAAENVFICVDPISILRLRFVWNDGLILVQSHRVLLIMMSWGWHMKPEQMKRDQRWHTIQPAQVSGQIKASVRLLVMLSSKSKSGSNYSIDWLQDFCSFVRFCLSNLISEEFRKCIRKSSKFRTCLLFWLLSHNQAHDL